MFEADRYDWEDFEYDNASSLHEADDKGPKARPLKNYFQGFRVLCRNLLGHNSFSATKWFDEVSFDAVTTDENARQTDTVEVESSLPFWLLAKNILFLKFNDDVRRFDLPKKTIVDKVLYALTLFTGSAELCLFSMARLSVFAGDCVDQLLIKRVGLFARFLLSLYIASVSYDPNFYENRNTWLGSLLKAVCSLFVLPVHFIWHFAVSKPFSVVTYADSRLSKNLYLFGLLLIIAVLVGMSCGLASVPVVAGLLAKLGFIQVVGDAVAAGTGTLFTAFSSVAIGEVVGAYFSWIAMMGLKACALFFLKIISFGPIVREEMSARAQKNKADAFEREAEFHPSDALSAAESKFDRFAKAYVLEGALNKPVENERDNRFFIEGDDAASDVFVASTLSSSRFSDVERDGSDEDEAYEQYASFQR